MGERRLYLIFLCLLSLLFGAGHLLADELSRKSFEENKSCRIYRAGPSLKDLIKERESERLKEEKAWEMLQNLILDVDRSSADSADK